MAADASPRRRALAYQALGDGDGEVDAAVIQPGTRSAPRGAPRGAVGHATQGIWPAVHPGVRPDRCGERSSRRACLRFRRAVRGASAAPALFSGLPPGGGGASGRPAAAPPAPSMVPWLAPAPRTGDGPPRSLGLCDRHGCDLRAEGPARRGPAPPGAGPNDDPKTPGPTSRPSTTHPGRTRAWWRRTGSVGGRGSARPGTCSDSR